MLTPDKPDFSCYSSNLNLSVHEDSKEFCNLLLNLKGLAGYHILSTEHFDEIYEIGYQSVKETDLSRLIIDKP